MQARLASVPLSSSLAAFTTAYSLWRCMPRSTRDAVWEYSERASDWLDPFCYYTFPEKGEGSPNVWYKFVKAYFEHQRLQGNRFQVTSASKSTSLPLALESGQMFYDVFMGVTMTWCHEQIQQTSGDMTYRYRLKLSKLNRSKVDAYLQHVRNEFEEIQAKDRDLTCYSNADAHAGSVWQARTFANPSTFDTLALKAADRQRVMAALDKFSVGEAYYKQTGRAHKMGFLLHGPPGTGKSSFAAAVANKMHYDLYFIDLQGGRMTNGCLQNLSNSLSDKAVILIEDIDTVGLLARKQEEHRKVDLGQNAYLQAMYLEHQHLTLGALLNFTDGVQSSSGTEHIFIFTTNFKERLDEALIRPGRMDVHLLMAFCDWEMFLTLCHNYLRISAHSMFSSIRRLLITKEVVPATVAGVLHANKDDANVAMSKVLELLQQL